MLGIKNLKLKKKSSLITINNVLPGSGLLKVIRERSWFWRILKLSLSLHDALCFHPIAPQVRAYSTPPSSSPGSPQGHKDCNCTTLEGHGLNQHGSPLHPPGNLLALTLTFVKTKE